MQTTGLAEIITLIAKLSPEVRQQIVEMARKASGIRDTARVLHVSTNTVMTELKNRPRLSSQ